MRVGVEETVQQDLVEVCADEFLGQAVGVDIDQREAIRAR